MNLIRKTYDTTEVQITSFQSSKGITEYHIFFQQTNCLEDFHTQLQHIQDVYARSVEELPGNPVAIFRRYFLSDVTNQTDELMKRERLSPYCALSIVQQAPMNGTKIALWAWLQTGVQTQVLPNGLFEARHGAYGQLLGANQCNRAANSEYQTRLLLNDYVMQLMGQRCTLASHCVRTWFFVQNVDVNYAGVVKARKEVFITQNLTEKTHYIASTGIEGRHADPSVLVQMDSYAVDGLEPGQIQFLYAPTHLNPTYEYGVTFERGTAVTYGDRKQVFISGTASIDNRGEIVYPGDIVKQTERMMENISVLLKEADATTRDITQAISYLRDMADYAVVKKYFEAHYPDLPHLIVLAPVCRPGWLIETECIAVVPTESSFKPL